MLAVSVCYPAHHILWNCLNRENSQVFVFVLFVPESSTDAPVPVFIAKPSVVFFTDYIVGHVYEVCFSDSREPLQVKNSQHPRLLNVCPRDDAQ